MEIFTGEGDQYYGGEDFLRTYLRTFRRESDQSKLEHFSCYLRYGSTADIWFRGLDSSKKKSWEVFLKEFRAYWPLIREREKSQGEYEDELLELRLEEESLLEPVWYGGSQVEAHIMWSSQVWQIAFRLNILDESVMLGIVWRNLPEPIRDRILQQPRTYRLLCEAVNNINIRRVIEVVLAKKKARLEEELIRKRILALEAQVQALSESVHHQCDPPSLVVARTLSAHSRTSAQHSPFSSLRRRTQRQLETATQAHIVNLYSAKSTQRLAIASPFRSMMRFVAADGKQLPVIGLVDDGAMISAIDRQFYETHKEWFGALLPTRTHLRMANGVIEPSLGLWEGSVDVDGLRLDGLFQVFNMDGVCQFIFGKPALEALKAIHDYETDTIYIAKGNRRGRLCNEHGKKGSDDTQWGVKDPPSRKVSADLELLNEPLTDATNSAPPINHFTNDSKTNIFTCLNDPFNEARVKAVLECVEIGVDLTNEQREKVIKIVQDYADCFALAVSEVKHIPGAVHKLNVPPEAEAKLPRSVHQRSFSPPQTQFLHETIADLIEAGVIERTTPEEVKCISPITIAQKAHDGVGLSLDELRQRVNERCAEYGQPLAFNLPPRSESTPEPPTRQGEKKNRLCINYKFLNDVTKTAPMPQGDIRMKQQRLSGHRWISVFDFASGFYAVEIDPESRPYTCFYVEGWGYFRWVRMPFGLTGAPSTFAHTTATHLHDLLVNTIELFVDDGGTAADDFEDGMAKLVCLLDRVRERSLSLSAKKTKLFMSHAVFAGGMVGPEGVTPDLSKLTAIVNFPQPEDGLQLTSFLGITGHFRDLVKNYARIEGPLQNLLRGCHVPKDCTKHKWRKLHQDYKLAGWWTEEHTKAFLELKKILTSEPVLRCPMWDG
jgi:hypothetical protein